MNTEYTTANNSRNGETVEGIRDEFEGSDT